MFGKVFVYLCIVGLFHEATCGPIEDLINELKPKIKEARLKVATVMKEGGTTIGQTYSSIEKNISELDKKLNAQKDQLHAAVEQAKVDAKNSGKNIGPCIDQEQAALKSTNRRDLEICRISPELNQLSIRVAEVAKLQIVLSKASVACVASSGGNLDKIRKCVEDAISSATQEAEKVENEIKSTASAAEDKATKCANDAATIIEAAYRKIAQDFSDCVSKA